MVVSSITNLFGSSGGLKGYDPFTELVRQQMQIGMRPISRQEYENLYAPKEEPKPDDSALILLTEEEE